MSMRASLPVLGLGLILGVLLIPAGRATDKPDDKEIARLIQQLGSDSFQDREEASKKLADIGLPAAEALRRAAKEGTDAEVRLRAEDLLRRLEDQIKKAEQKAQAEKWLKATMVHLVFKDTPLVQAVAEFQKQSGYTLIFQNSLASQRKITLDTGEVSFWEALDKFCDAAGLVESITLPQPPASTLPPNRPVVPVPPQGGAGGGPPVKVGTARTTARNPVTSVIQLPGARRAAA